jgi:hypothetical protein
MMREARILRAEIGSPYARNHPIASEDGLVLNTATNTSQVPVGSTRASVGRVASLASTPAAATILVFLPMMLRSPSTTQAPPFGWLVALVLGPPLAAYIVSRRLGTRLSTGSYFLAGLPQLPVLVLLAAASVWLDVRRGHLLADSGEEAMSYGIGMTVASIAGIALLILVAIAARLGARRPIANSADEHQDP